MFLFSTTMQRSRPPCKLRVAHTAGQKRLLTLTAPTKPSTLAPTARTLYTKEKTARSGSEPGNMAERARRECVHSVRRGSTIARNLIDPCQHQTSTTFAQGRSLHTSSAPAHCSKAPWRTPAFTIKTNAFSKSATNKIGVANYLSSLVRVCR
jgi:hypothetical protein